MTPDIFKDIEALIAIAALLVAVLNWGAIQASLHLGKDRNRARYL